MVPTILQELARAFSGFTHNLAYNLVRGYKSFSLYLANLARVHPQSYSMVLTILQEPTNAPQVFTACCLQGLTELSQAFLMDY